MSRHVDVLGSAATIIVVLAVLGWIASAVRRDATVAHLLWGIGLVAATWSAWAVGDGLGDRRNLLVAMVTIWGVRLTGHLVLRHRGQPEDFRFARRRERAGPRFAATSLFTVFLPTAVLMWVTSLPVQLAMTPSDPAIGWLAIVGVLVWGTGLFFETVGDAQLTRFHQGDGATMAVMDWGLWRYTRHPNHFGECCVWWGLFLVAAETADARWALVGPLIVTVLLVQGTGAASIERRAHANRAGYSSYADRTSAFIPRTPKDRSA